VRNNTSGLLPGADARVMCRGAMVAVLLVLCAGVMPCVPQRDAGCVSSGKARVLWQYHALWAERHPHAPRHEVDRRRSAVHERIKHRCGGRDEAVAGRDEAVEAAGAGGRSGSRDVMDLARCLSTCSNKSHADECRVAYNPQVRAPAVVATTAPAVVTRGELALRWGQARRTRTRRTKTQASNPNPQPGSVGVKPPVNSGWKLRGEYAVDERGWTGGAVQRWKSCES
jgi:hypothetical protein